MTAVSYCGIWKKPSTHESNQFSWKENITPISFAWLSTVAIRRCSLEVRKSSLIHWSLSCDCLRVEAMSEILPYMKGLFNNPLCTWKLTLISTWRFFWNREFFSKHNIFNLIMLLFFSKSWCKGSVSQTIMRILSPVLPLLVLQTVEHHLCRSLLAVLHPVWHSSLIFENLCCY